MRHLSMMPSHTAIRALGALTLLLVLAAASRGLGAHLGLNQADDQLPLPRSPRASELNSAEVAEAEALVRYLELRYNGLRVAVAELNDAPEDDQHARAAALAAECDRVHQQLTEAYARWESLKAAAKGLR